MVAFTHFDKQGKAQMVDVSGKEISHRIAIAEGRILLQAETLDAIVKGEQRKGDVLGVARLAGIMAAKRTAELVPLCHPLSLSTITVDFETCETPPAILCRSRVEIHAKTGIEMEALTAVQIALLTIYDMCKATDRGMVISNIRLIEKSGGRSGHWRRSDKT